MSALINIAPSTIGGASVPTVNARDLHAFLESKRQFANWIKERIQQYSFVENQDFVMVLQNCETKGRGGDRRSIDYHLTLDMAKELSMVERNAKGKQARQYFIECERQAKEPALDPRNLTRLQLMQIAMDAEQERLALAHKVAEQEPKVEVYNRIAEDSGTYLVRQAAKVLGVGPQQFVAWLLDRGWVYRHANKGHLLAYQDKLERGWLAHKLTPFWNRHTQMNEVSAALRVTPLGMTVLAKQADHMLAA